MTDQELLAQAAQHARKAKITADDYLSRVRWNGLYDYKKTEWYKAIKALQQLREQPTPPPVPAVDLSPVRSVLILADDPWGALESPPHYQFWITADEGYRDYYDDGKFIAAARRQGRTIRSWCDCKPGGTPPEIGLLFAREWNLGFAGEGESPAAFDTAYNAGARVMVVDLAALRPDQIGKIATGEVICTVELYRNDQPDMKPDWRNANAGIGGNCIAVNDEKGHPLTLNDYRQAGYLTRGVSVYAGGTPKPAWKELP